MRGRKWTEEEIKFLKDNLGSMSNQEIANALGRNIGSVAAKATKLNVPRKNNRKWTEEDYQFLRDNAATMTNEEIAKALDRNIGSVAKIIPAMGLERKTAYAKWSEKDVAFLKNNAINMSNKQLAKALNRNIGSITAKLSELQLGERENITHKKWTEDEVNFLKNNASNMTNKELAKALNRSVGSVSLKVSTMNIPRKHNKKEWTEDELKFIRDNIKKLTYVEMGQKLGRSAESCRGKANGLGIGSEHKVDRVIIPWTDWEESYLLEHSDISSEEIAEALNRSVYSVQNKKRQLGLGREAEGRRAARIREKQWTDDNAYFLVSSYPSFDFDFIATFLGISELECKRKYLSLSDKDKQDILSNFKKQEKLV